MSRKRRNAILTMSLVTILFLVATAATAHQPRYVFFFVGDGMGSSQIQATEAYLTTLNGGSANRAEDLLKPENRLNMTKMPVLGMQTTWDAFALVTDSASAGTAFACGVKTRSGVIGMNSTMTTRYKSVAQLAHERGWKVGIMSSVSLDQATPASYYASVSNRGLMNNIGSQMAATGYEFFGGGGLAKPSPTSNPGSDTNNDLWSLLAYNGYTVLNDRESILALKQKPRHRVVCINPWLQDSAAMPYAMDRPATNLSLAEMTEVAIAVLHDRSRRSKGFFLVVEAGKIDWACHANDAVAAMGDVLDLDNAVGVALEFSRKHPGDTLIIVTGDHETGGMSVGHATMAYSTRYDRLLYQKNSFQYFGANQWAGHKAENQAGVCPHVDQPDNLATNTAMLRLMERDFGLKWSELDTYQRKKLEDAYDLSLCGRNNNLPEENRLFYGGAEPIVVTITHILNERAGIGWTSYSHTGVPVPVFAQGRQAERFAGFYDNTDIAQRLAGAMGIGATLPVAK